MKIGIFTFHRAYNCGAMLQAWALKTVLERMGHEVFFPKCNNVGETPRWRPWCNANASGLKFVRSVVAGVTKNLLSIGADGLSQKRYKEFRRRYLPEKEFERKSVGNDYDLLVFGSDQIWRPSLCTQDERDVFFIREFGDGVRKIVYAASYDDKPLVGEEAEMLKNAVVKYDRVSVREKLVADQLAELTGMAVPVVLDPTMLLTANDYLSIECADFPSGEYLYLYTLYATPFIMNTARAVAKRLGLKLVATPVYQFSRFGAQCGLTYGVSPDRLISYVNHAKYVMSYSFHGTVFSLLFGKKFVDLRPKVDEHETRSGSILRQLGVYGRMANPKTPIDDIVKMLEAGLPLGYDGKLDCLRRQSLDWLQCAVNDIQGGIVV